MSHDRNRLALDRHGSYKVAEFLSASSVAQKKGSAA